MPSTGPIQPDPSVAIPPPQSKEALFHKGMSAASLIAELGVILRNQIDGIEKDNYQIKMTKWLQEGLKEFTQAISEMQAGTYPKGINDLLKALRDLHDIHGMSAKQLGGPFGIKEGEGIKAAITAMYNGINKALGGFLKPGAHEGGYASAGKILQNYLKDPSKYPLTVNQMKDMQYAINQMVAQALTPMKNLSIAINDQVSALDAMSALAIANFGRGKNNGTTALQLMGKTTSQFWKILIQMISTVQSG